MAGRRNPNQQFLHHACPVALNARDRGQRAASHCAELVAYFYQHAILLLYLNDLGHSLRLKLLSRHELSGRACWAHDRTLLIGGPQRHNGLR
eukprot:9493813-Pyramimonas_sp.AAC.1